MPDTFTISGKEYPYAAPRGKNGRRATAYLLSVLGSDFSGGDQNKFMGLITQMFQQEEFERHLPSLLGVDAKTLEEEGDLGEILQAVLGQVERIFRTFNREDVSTALKNSPEGRAEGEAETH